MRILHWNCQGMRNPLTIRYLRDITNIYSPDIMFLVETKNEDTFVQDVGKQLRYENCVLVSPRGTSGGMATFWKSTISCTVMGRQMLNKTDFLVNQGGQEFILTYIYGNPEKQARNELWVLLIEEAQRGLYDNKPRLLVGDFNDISGNDEKKGGPNRPEAAFRQFRMLKTTLGLMDIPMTGDKFTWVGNRGGYIVKSCIDRAMANGDWLQMFPTTTATPLQWIGSDHKLIVVQVDVRKHVGKRLFRYENRWRREKQVYEVIHRTWAERGRLCRPWQLNKALIYCRRSLSDWKHNNNTNSRKQIDELQVKLDEAYNKESLDYNYISSIKKELNNQYRMKEEYWRTKSRIQWLAAGDKNTKFFHSKAIQRRNNNRIVMLKTNDGVECRTHEEISDLVSKYFEELYTPDGLSDASQVLQDLPPRVPPEMNDSLIRDVTEEEVYNALKQMNIDKSPGIDGFNVGFYRHHWSVIRKSVFGYVEHFFKYGYIDPDINHTIICLIPKIDSPQMVKDFRPISLCNVAYKLISKVLADRLKPWLNRIISENQTAFIQGRLITDNVLIAHELLHSLRTRRLKEPYMAMKLDIAKAFDKVRWDYIEFIMRKFGFAGKWCEWIKTCITTVTYSVLINGSPEGRIHPHSGIRQGDPLSPYLYLLCSEGLSYMIERRVNQGGIQGFSASRGGPVVSHMFFADDSLVFCKANKDNCESLLAVLEDYRRISGQKVNFQKSSISFGKGIAKDRKVEIAQILGIQNIGGFGKYLGLPEAVGKEKTSVFSYIAQRVCKKMESWYAKLLSPAGKETLIKAVIQALPTYSMSCFMLPQNIISILEKNIRRFFWSAHKDKNKIPWIPWETITKSKKDGGLGMRDLKLFNLALLAKQSWRLLKMPDSLLGRIYKAKYFPNTSLLAARTSAKSSHAWRSICKGNEVIAKGIQWRIGDGKNVYVWTDNWIPGVPYEPPVSKGQVIDKNLKVSDIFTEGTRQWNVTKLKELFTEEDAKKIQRIIPSLRDTKDFLSWRYTKDGVYSVKSGYHLLKGSGTHDKLAASSSAIATLSSLYGQLWKLSVPPKIRHFWWRVLHEALPIASNLVKRGLKVDTSCVLCGEKMETIKHILFTCRVSKEVWELSPLRYHLARHSENENVADVISELLASQSTEKLRFPFIGWGIWKARNSMLFRGERVMIPNIIELSNLQYAMWQEAQVEEANEDQQKRQGAQCNQTRQRSGFPIPPRDQNRRSCFVDASWKSAGERCEYGWTLFDQNGTQRVVAQGTMDSAASPLEAEAMALKEAVLQVRRLGYSDIDFYTDSQQLSNMLQQARQVASSKDNREKEWRHSTIALILDDIALLTAKITNSGCKYVSRKLNILADNLARLARIRNISNVVKWL